MTFAIDNATATWATLTSDQWSRLPRQIQIGAMPAFPLANSVDLPASFEFNKGSLAARLLNLGINFGQDIVPKILDVSEHGNRIRVQLQFGSCAIAGEHQLETRQIWDANIDGAGTSLPLDENGRIRHPGGTDTNQHPTWIATARAQRDKLNTIGGNGTTLLSTYTTHRSALNDVFADPSGYVFQINWGTDSISSMADHTNKCLTSNPALHVNGNRENGDTTYQNGLSYNGNSQQQQLALATTLVGMGSTQDDGSPDPNCPYQKAATAVVNFKQSILRSTGASKVDTIPQKTASGVYATVKTGRQAPEISVAQTHQLLNGESIGGRDTDGTAWHMVLDDEEREFVRDFRARHQQHLEQLAATKPLAIATGATLAHLDEFHLLLEFKVNDNQQLTLCDGRIELDSFDLELDDQHWPEWVRAIACDELSRMHFLRSLVHDRVADALERELVGYVFGVLVDAL